MAANEKRFASDTLRLPFDKYFGDDVDTVQQARRLFMDASSGYDAPAALSKSIGGSGLPMALTLIRPELDVWEPGEHNGTFRGNNLAFVGATAALDYWCDASFQTGVAYRATLLQSVLNRVSEGCLRGHARAVGRGLFVGLRFEKPARAEDFRKALLAIGVLAETCGPSDEVVKFMPAINIPEDILVEGLHALEGCAEEMVP